MTHPTPTDAQLAARATQAARRSGATFQAYLEGKTRKPPLFHPDDPTRPFDPDDSRHGTLSAYTSGCRCMWCRMAGKDHRAYKKAGLKLPKGFNVRHAEVIP